MSNFFQRFKNFTLTVGLLSLPVISNALLVQNPNMPMEALVSDSDEIIIGKVVAKDVVVENRNIVSKYEVQITENLKSKTKDYAPGKTFSLSLDGGTPTSSPISRYVPGMPHMFKGEDVVLFLKTQPTEFQKTKNLLPKSGVVKPRIVGYNQGRFTVVEDAAGKKNVIRLGEQQGLVNEGELTYKTVEAIKNNALRLRQQKLVRGKDLAAGISQKDPLEVKADDQAALKKEAALQTGEMIRGSINAGGIPAQDLESFKSDIRTFIVK